MEEILQGGTGEPPPPPPPPPPSDEDQILAVVGNSAPFYWIVQLKAVMEGARESGRREAGADRDELIATRALLADSESRRRHQVEALLSDLRELPIMRRKLGDLATMVAVNESRASFAEKKAEALEAAQLARVDDRPGGALSRAEEALGFAHGQIDTLHAEIIKLQEANARLENLRALLEKDPIAAIFHHYHRSDGIERLLDMIISAEAAGALPAKAAGVKLRRMGVGKYAGKLPAKRRRKPRRTPLT